MKRFTLFVSTLMLTIGLFTLSVQSELQAVEGNQSPQALLRSFRQERGGGVRVEWQEGNRRIRTLRGNLSDPLAGTPEEAAFSFVSDHEALFSLPDEAEAALRTGYVKEMYEGTYDIKLEQVHLGLPVFFGGIEVYLDQESSVFLLHNSIVPEITAPDSPVLSEDDAVETAREDFLENYSRRIDKSGTVTHDVGEEFALRKSPEIERGYYERGERVHLVYRFILNVERPFGVREYLIDTQTGEVLFQRNLVKNFDGIGKVFDPNPVNTLNDGWLGDNNDADSSVFDPAYFNVTLLDLTVRHSREPSFFNFFGLTDRPDDPRPFLRGSGSNYFLTGPYVYVNAFIEYPKYPMAGNGFVTSGDGVFDFTRGALEFEHVMVYYHIDTNQRYIQSMGFNDVFNLDIRVDPHGVSGENNSHYIADPPGQGYLAFGQGGVDDAEDADVILHEYGHAIQNNQTYGKYQYWNNEAGAMAEGFGDYWAASNTYDISMANGIDPECMFEWDVANDTLPGIECMRRVDTDKIFPDNYVGEDHADGEIWSAFLWDLFDNLTMGKETTDSLVLESHFLVPDNPKFRDGVNAILAADELLYAEANRDTICAKVHSRGFTYTECDTPTAFERWFGGSGTDGGRSVQLTDDGGYVIAGTTNSFGAGSNDVYLVKTDAGGDSLWARTFGGANSDYGYSVQVTDDGGYVIAGVTTSFGAGNSDAYLVKTDSDGNELWYQTFGGSGDDVGLSVQQTDDGGYVITGYTMSFGTGWDVYLVKTDSLGSELWYQTFTGDDNANFGDWGNSVQQTLDGGYVVAGVTTAYDTFQMNSQQDVYLIKTDGSGNELWSQTFGEACTSCSEEGNSVQQTSDGGYVIAGLNGVLEGGWPHSEVCLIKTDGSGNELWSQTFSDNEYDIGRSVQQTLDGGYVITGSTGSLLGGWVVYLVKTDSDGNELWSQTFDGGTWGEGFSVQQTLDGGYVIGGAGGISGSDVYLIKTDEAGLVHLP